MSAEEQEERLKTREQRRSQHLGGASGISGPALPISRIDDLIIGCQQIICFCQMIRWETRDSLISLSAGAGVNKRKPWQPRRKELRENDV